MVQQKEQEEFGFVTVAMGQGSYLEMAVDMVLSLRQFHHDPVCLLCDEATEKLARTQYAQVFDHIVRIDVPLRSPLASNFFVPELAPFDRGFCIDADVIVLGSLQRFIDETRSNPISIMGKYVGPGSGLTHHGISIDRLLKIFDIPNFFTNHIGAYGYQQDAAKSFFRHSAEIYEKLYGMRWRLWGHMGAELAFGIAASGLDLTPMSQPDPMYWPDEFQHLDLATTPQKPLLHFIGALPDDTLEMLIVGITSRRQAIGLALNSERAWRKKNAKATRNVMRATRTNLSLSDSGARVLRNLNTIGSLLAKSGANGMSNDSSPAGSAGRHRKIYHHHLMHCVSHEFNDWILDHFPEQRGQQREIQKQAYARHEDEPIHALRDRKKLRSFAQDAFAALDCVIDHAPIACFTPHNTIRATCLRNGRDRLISHCEAWRRYTDAQIETHRGPMKRALLDLHSVPLKDFLENVARSKAPPRHLLDNYMTRALAENRVGVLAVKAEDPAWLLPIALEVLSEDFDIVGVDHADFSFRCAIARRMRWRQPVVPLSSDMAGRKEVIGEVEICQAEQMIEDFTRYDEIVFSQASTLLG